MKIIVLHGTDTEKSYARLTKFIAEAKKRNWEIVNDKIEDTASLFGLEKLIIVRDLKILDKKALNLIDKIAGTLVIYSEKTIPQTILKTLPKDIKIEKFELPELIWKFLDSFDIKMFNELAKTHAPEYLLAMIAWKLKKRYLQSPTQKNADLIKNLAEIDVKVKTGNFDLKRELDLFILKKLQ